MPCVPLDLQTAPIVEQPAQPCKEGLQACAELCDGDVFRVQHPDELQRFGASIAHHSSLHQHVGADCIEERLCCLALHSTLALNCNLHEEGQHARRIQNASGEGRGQGLEPVLGRSHVPECCGHCRVRGRCRTARGIELLHVDALVDHLAGRVLPLHEHTQRDVQDGVSANAPFPECASRCGLRLGG